jgi:serine/threonine protein kinase/Tol biopolymer transport system component
LIGKTLAHYEITSLLGKGGMGEVYSARDTKLNRSVAIKLLPAEVSSNPEWVQRFQREAHTLATLQNENVASIYGFEVADGVRFLVMEHVEGEDLRQRLERGALPMDEAIAVARQIANGLEAAHEVGIVHRDLKPANVKVRRDGTVKLLDFGLAKGVAAASGGSLDMSNSPTMAALATQEGLILGTAAYMAPEQARGKLVDRRADIWAFGIVLYEMLTGRRAFEGEDVSEILASVIKDDPPWDALPRDLPPSIGRLLRRCLAKDPKRRLSAIGDARLELDDESAGENTGEEWGQAAMVATPTWKRVLPWTVAGIATVVLLVFGWRSALSPKTESPGIVTQFEVPLGSGQRLTTGLSIPAVSHAGDAVAFTVRDGTRSRIMLRRLGEREAVPVAGTEDGQLPFFSPDGEWIGFSRYGGALYKVPVEGGERSVLAEVHGAWWNPYATWVSDGRIIADGLGNERRLVVVQVDTREVKPLTEHHFEGEEGHTHPEVLPDGTVLFAVAHDGRSTLARYFPNRGDWTDLGTEGTGPIEYLRSGQLVFQQAGSTVIAAFDPGGNGTIGPARRVLEAAHPDHFAISPSGTVAYVDFQEGTGLSLVRVDRSGGLTPLLARIDDYRWPRLSPDGRRLAVGVGDVRESHLWLVDLADGRRDRIQDDGTLNGEPVWSPAGERIAYSSLRATADVYWQASRGGNSEVLSAEPFDQWPTSISPDGKLLLFYTGPSGGYSDIRVARTDGGGTAEVVVDDPGFQRGGRFSPDGRWLLYSSQESGASAIYVRRYPELDRKSRVSPAGGVDPAWSSDGREIFYLDGRRMIAVAFDPEAEAPVGKGTVLFEAPFVFDPTGDQSYDVFPDGRSFVMKFPDLESPPRLFVMTGFLDQVNPPT